MSKCDAREDSQCLEEVAGLAHSPATFLLLLGSPATLILRVRHCSFTSFDTPNNGKADQGANSVHDLFAHNG